MPKGVYKRKSKVSLQSSKMAPLMIVVSVPPEQKVYLDLRNQTTGSHIGTLLIGQRGLQFRPNHGKKFSECGMKWATLYKLMDVVQ